MQVFNLLHKVNNLCKKGALIIQELPIDQLAVEFETKILRLWKTSVVDKVDGGRWFLLHWPIIWVRVQDNSNSRCL